MEYEPFPEYRYANEFEEPVGYLCGTDLQQDDDPLHQEIGNWYYEKQEQEWKKCKAGCLEAVEKNKPPDPTDNRREGHQGEKIVQIEVRSPPSPDKVDYNPGNNQNTSGNYRETALREYFSPPGEYQVYGHQGNENDVGIQLVPEGKFD